MATFGELLRTAVGSASVRVAEGSRRNARQAIGRRHDENREARDVLAALEPTLAPPPIPRRRRA